MKFDPSSAQPVEPFDPNTAVPEEAPPVRAVLQTAVKQNPDQVARATALGKQYGVPTDVVARNLQDVEFQAAVDAADERLKTSPKLAAAMRKRPEMAQLAHDDLAPLTEVEAAVAKYGEWKAWNGPAPTLKNIALGLAKAVPQAGSAIKAGLDAQMSDFLEWTGLITLDPITKADRARKLAQASGAADFTRPEFESSTGRAIYGGLESTLRMIPGLAASIVTRSPTPMLAAAGVQSEAEAYGKYRTRGATGGQALVGAVGGGAVEVATELLPAGFLTSRLGKAGVGEFVSGLLAREIPGEQIATLLQDAIDTAVANPDKTWGEYLAERPQAAYETLVSTLTQSALMGGVHGAARRLAQMGDQGQQADEASTALGDALKRAGASALRERSPEQFRALMGEMTDGKIYVDGEVLNQLPDDVKASLPQTVQDQIATAAATGDVVEISTADALTVAPGTALEEVLVEHARTDPFAMSKADAAEATKLAQSSVMNDAQRLIEQAQDTEARQAEYDAIHKLYADQLNAAARFRPAVNEAKAHWLASFYTTMAARTGMTPAQFQAAHPVSILGAPTSAGQQVMDTVMGQAKDGEIVVEGYHFSKEDRPTITTAAYGTGLEGAGFREDSPGGESEGGTTYVAFESSQVKSATGNRGTFDANDPSILSQTAAQTPRGTFNPRTLELVLNPNANLSTFFHETGHFFLEVLADVASQPNAPAQIVEDMQTFLKWAGIADLQTWNGLDLDGKRAAHERWAESIEQYVMEGRAPSVELQPLMRRFATWLKSVYGSIQKFLAARGQARAAGGSALNQAPAPEGVLTEEDGKPLVVYHGTRRAFNKFDPGTMGANVNPDDFGFFFTNNPQEAAAYADPEMWDNASAEDQPNVVAAYLLLKNPKRIDILQDEEKSAGSGAAWYDAFGAEAARQALAEGHDGLILGDFSPDAVLLPDGTNPIVYVAFDPKQIVSAISGEVLGQDPAAQPGPPMALNDDIRRVMDRLLATDEQIAQANEVAGLVPNEDADAAAAERLAKRSIADLKWSVRARDQIIAKLRKQAAAIEKDLREQVTVEVDQTPEMRAKKALDALTVSPEYAGTLAEHKAARKAAEATVREEVKGTLLVTNPDAKGLVKGQLLMKNKRDIDNKVDAAMIKWDQANPTPARPVNATDADVATIADSFGFESVDAMMQAIDAFGSRREAIDGLTERRMLEEHGDLIDERAISEAANEAVHNEARARSLASELRTQREMLNPRAETGETNARGAKVTVNALVEAAKQFAANVVSRTTLRDLTARAWQHTAAERRAAARWQQATAAGKTEEAVKAKQDQMLNHAAAKAAIDAKAEAKRILDFFKRVTKGNDETVVEKGRDPDIVNAARAALAAYGVQGPATKNAADYLETLSRNDPETYNVILPMVEGATRNAQPLDALTFEELQALEEEIQAMWFLAKRSRQMEVDGDLLDVQDVAEEVYARLEEIGIPDTLPGETGALTEGEIRARRWLQQVPALLRRVEQWAEAKDGKFGGPFSRFIFGPVKTAADKYRTDRVEYRKKFQALVDNIAPMMPAKTIAAPELGYVFGRGHNGIGMSELLHAIAHTGNESNKRKLLLGRGWAADNGDGAIDTGKWDAFIARLAADGTLQREHFDFVQGVWDLMEQTKPLAQQTHRAVFGRYFAEVTADAFVDPFGVARSGGYIPAQADPLLVQDADLRELLETDNAGMSQAFPATNKGFTKSRVEYNRPLKLDLRTLPQHIDKVLLFSHMEPAVRGVARLLRQPKVSQPLSRVDPAAIGGMLKPWLNRSARQTVETPVSADAGLNRVLSTTRARVGMALMFANVSNTLQQITGFFPASLKVKPALMMRAAAQFIAQPKRFSQAVHALSPFMADRASNEVAVLSDTMEKILINPGVFARAESWTRQHAYFLQTAFDNVMSPIIWSGAYNQGVAEGMDERMAVRFADGVIRQTQGSTLPEDVSRIETGPAYARVFTQFIGYFNMLANTNSTALQQIAQEQGLKKGAGKAFGVVMLGLLTPIWVAEVIAQAFRGGPDDEDKDGYLDDWLAAVFGFGTIRGILSGVPFIGQAAQAGVNRFNSQPADDKFSLSPTVSVLESAVGAPASVYAAIVEDKNAQKAVRDVSALITVATGLPGMAVARPLGYLAGVAQGRIEPTGAADAARGLVTGTASPESKQR